VGPPVPRVEDQRVHPHPRVTVLDRVKLQNSSHFLTVKIH